MKIRVASLSPLKCTAFELSVVGRFLNEGGGSDGWRSFPWWSFGLKMILLLSISSTDAYFPSRALAGTSHPRGQTPAKRATGCVEERCVHILDRLLPMFLLKLQACVGPVYEAGYQA